MYIETGFYIQNFDLVASFCGCADRIVSYLVGNPEDRFFIMLIGLCNKLLFFTPVKNDKFFNLIYIVSKERQPQNL